MYFGYMSICAEGILGRKYKMESMILLEIARQRGRMNDHILKFPGAVLELEQAMDDLARQVTMDFSGGTGRTNPYNEDEEYQDSPGKQLRE